MSYGEAIILSAAIGAICSAVAYYWAKTNADNHWMNAASENYHVWRGSRVFHVEEIEQEGFFTKGFPLNSEENHAS